MRPVGMELKDSKTVEKSIVINRKCNFEDYKVLGGRGK